MLEKVVSIICRLWLCALAFNSEALYSTETEVAPVLQYDISGSSGWYPYYIEGNPPRGILLDVVKAVLKKANIQGKALNLPPKRTQKALELGLIDFDLVSPDWFPKTYDISRFVFSKAILPVDEYVIVLKNTKLPDKFLAPLSAPKLKPTIGTVRGYYYHDVERFTRMDFKSEKEIVLALSKQRVAYGISGDLPALFWARKLNVDIELASLHSSGFIHFRLQKKYAYLLPKINAAIVSLKATGQIQAILDSYL